MSLISALAFLWIALLLAFVGWLHARNGHRVHALLWYALAILFATAAPVALSGAKWAALAAVAGVA